MKNHSLLYYTTIVSMFSFNCFAQNASNLYLNQKKIGDSKTNVLAMTDKNYPGKKVAYYHVEEIINVKFGGHKTTYDVTDPELINTSNLGPNNTRVITPKFANAENNTLKLKAAKSRVIEDSSAIATTEIKKKKNVSVYIDVIKTYERMYDKGYRSVDMLKKTGNAYFFNGDMDSAAKSYADLFKMTSDLEPEYYYRFSLSLRSIGENDKANEMLKKFNELSGNTARE
ncbi:tetratricopeptide repeat protein [Flavobacterium sp. T12S277]|uniref:tetratricopeptide repeat protein n=1 Tax=Flavobacterium sp. T12S277 TaxID=3402752 RepID=UPI003AE24EDC